MLDYHRYDALELSALVRSGEVRAEELLAAAQARLAAFNPSLNAVVTPMDALAQDLIGRLGGQELFCGVPFLVKDLMLKFKDFPMSNGSQAMKEYRPSSDSDMAVRLNTAGLLTFGKTNTSEFGTSSLVNNAVYGKTLNPWDLTKNSGGSSGGSAAAVAARIVPMAYASDGGGSIRLPASYCGIFGFKPSRGLNRYEDLSRAWGGAVVTHVCTVSVRDSAAYLDLAAGHAEPNYSADKPPEQSYLYAATRTPKPLRIALIKQSPAGTPVHSECIAAAESAAKLCETLGHDVEESAWNFDGRELMRAFLTVVLYCTARDVANMAQWLDVAEPKLAIELNTRFVAAVGKGVGEQDFHSALAVWKQAAVRLAEFHRRYDLILTPTVATPPLASEALDPNALERCLIHAFVKTGTAKMLFSDGFIDLMSEKAIYQTPFTPIANMSGQPAMSVPLFWGQDGLPHGVQFMAEEGNDRLLFRLAAQLEVARPWKYRLPPLCG